MENEPKFLTIEDLQGQPPAGVSPFIRDSPLDKEKRKRDFPPDEWEGILFDIKWGRLKDLFEQNIITPETLWWKYLQDTIIEALSKGKKDNKRHNQHAALPEGEESDMLVKDICKEVLNYFHKQLISDKLSGAFNTIFQCGNHLISGNDYKALRGIRSRLRKTLGFKGKPPKLYSPPTPKQATGSKRDLAQGIDFLLKPHIDVEKARSRYIANIFISCRIEGSNKKIIAETIRKAYLRHKDNPFKDANPIKLPYSFKGAE